MFKNVYRVAIGLAIFGVTTIVVVLAHFTTIVSDGTIQTVVDQDGTIVQVLEPGLHFINPELPRYTSNYDGRGESYVTTYRFDGVNLSATTREGYFSGSIPAVAIDNTGVRVIFDAYVSLTMSDAVEYLNQLENKEKAIFLTNGRLNPSQVASLLLWNDIVLDPDNPVLQYLVPTDPAQISATDTFFCEQSQLILVKNWFEVMDFYVNKAEGLVSIASESEIKITPRLIVYGDGVPLSC